MLCKFSDPVKLLDWLIENDWADVSHLLPNLVTEQKIAAVKQALIDWDSLDTAEKRLRARTLLQQEIPDTGASATTNGIQNLGPESDDGDDFIVNDSIDIGERRPGNSPLDLFMHDQPRVDTSHEENLSDIAPKSITVLDAAAMTIARTKTLLITTNSVTPRPTTRLAFPPQKGVVYFSLLHKIC